MISLLHRESPHRRRPEVLPKSPTEDHLRYAAYTRERQLYWDQYAGQLGRWERFRRYYRSRLTEVFKFLVPPGMRVLELGSGRGDLLAALKPAYGVGVDLSPLMVQCAQKRYPQLTFLQGDAHQLDLSEQFDVIILSDLINDLWDVQKVFQVVKKHSLPSTRIILNTYSRLWEGPRRIAELLGIAKRQLEQNWLTVEDTVNLLHLTDLEVISTSSEVICPLPLPGLGALSNRYLVKLWPLRHLALANLIIARPRPQAGETSEPVVSVIVPARNEAGNIKHIFDRVPQMGRRTELIFVEGHSTDGTWTCIEREIARRPGVPARAFRQTGKGKGDAVRLGFAQATGDLLMILDADLTVPPEDLPRFYEAWRSGKAEFVNGVRLVYPMEKRAMRFCNFLGNKFFSLAFSWLLNQSIKDTLCGTKVLGRRHYETIAANRSYFGDFDPFGDFDLIFGAAKYSLKMVDVPIRYRERVYGETNIQRWRHGLLLLRMVLFACRRIKFV